MPIRPEELARFAAPVLIAEEWKCRKCGYNLIGLKTDARCPECGRLILDKKRGPRFGDQMIDAPMSWLKVFRRGAGLLMAGGWIMSLGLLAWSWLRLPACGVVAMIGAGLWAFGSVLATRPRPKTKASLQDPVQEWRTLRPWGRWSQPFWAVAIGLTLGEQLSDAISPELVWGSGICFACAMIGCWPMLILISNLAFWASDTDLANRLRNAPIGLGIGLAIGVGVLSLIGDNIAGSLLGSLLFVAAWAGPILVSLGYMLIALWQLWRMSSWVMLNQANAALRDDRLRARAMRARAPAKPL
jgi:DNA-directed RNA polymerase subunit RPC12/RpoP